jgi:hypothetical protein
MAGLCDVAKVFDGDAGSMNNRGELRGQRAATRLQMSKRILHRRLVICMC